MQDLKQCVRYTLRHSDEWLFLTVQTSLGRPTRRRLGPKHEVDEIDIISVHEDRWIYHCGERTAAGHVQCSGECEFCALGAGCADGLYVKAVRDDLGM